jgi:hypothetical protein
MEDRIMTEQLVTIAQIERTQDFLLWTAYKTPVWKCLIWTDYEKKLPFMADADNFQNVNVNIGSVFIDQKMYVRVNSAQDVFTAPERYFVGPNSVYIHFRDHRPPYVFLYKQYGSIQGFSNDELVVLEGFTYLPELLEVPAVSESSDPLTYAKMKFNSGTYNFNNTHGQFDAASGIFGNKFNILAGKKGWLFNQYKKIIQYYVSNISFGLHTAQIEVKDLRELLSIKVPDNLYTEAEYPYLNDSDIDKVKQDAYGFCYNVKGTCINWSDVYIDPVYQIKRTDRIFRFARAIKEIEYIEIKQGGSTIDGAPPDDERNQDTGWTRFEQKRDENGAVVLSWADQGFAIHSDGTVTIDYFKVFPLKGALPDVTKKTYEVRAAGVFVDIHNPGAVIKDIMEYYGRLQVDQVFDNAEFDSELGKLPDIGICLDDQEDMYAVIEKIQSGSLLGFQFMGRYDKYTARLDNPNRAESAVISSGDILNLDEVEVDLNADLYATYTDMKYQKKWYIEKEDEEEYLHEINKSKRDEIMNIHRIDKVHEEELLVNNSAVAALKGKIMLEDFSEIRPVISGIKLFGITWFDLRVYDIVTIDFRHIEKQDTRQNRIVKLLESANKFVASGWSVQKEIITMKDVEKKSKNRNFTGKLRCQILSREIDMETGIVTLSVRQRERSAYLGAEYD